MDGAATAGFHYGQIEYKKLQPVTPQTCAGKALKVRSLFAMARRLQTCPVVLSELAQVARCFPIVFVPAKVPMPIAVFRLSVGPNPYVQNGLWKGNTYLPAAIRRYPFDMQRTSGEAEETLMVDAHTLEADGTNAHPLFDQDGHPTKMLTHHTHFCREYALDVARTVEVCSELSDLAVFERKRFDFVDRNGERRRTDDFLTINMEEFSDLSDDVAGKLHRNGALGLAHAHHVSMGHVDVMISHEGRGQKPSAPTGTTAASA